MGAALLEPLGHIYGIGSKIWSMALADLLLGADPARERWVTTGAAMIVIDTPDAQPPPSDRHPSPVRGRAPLWRSMLRPRRLRRPHPGLGRADRCPRVQPRLPGLLPALCSVRDLAAVLGLRTRRLQRQPDRRSRPRARTTSAPRSRRATGWRCARSDQPDCDALTRHETINEIPLKSTRAIGWAFLTGSPARDPDP